MSPLTSFSSPRALPRRRKTSSCRPCRASREAATTSARICRRPMHAGEGGGARQSARTLGGTGARPLESMAHRTQLSAERPQRSGAPNGCAPCQWRADAQARERRCPSFSMELAMSSVWVPCWSARRPVRILFSKTLALEGRLDRSLPSVESQKFKNRVRRKNHQSKHRLSSEKGTGNAVPSKRFHLVTHIANCVD